MSEIVAHSRYTGLLDSLRVDDSTAGKRGFKTYRDIMRFAAMVGFDGGIREKSDAKGKSVPLRIFENTKDHHLIYLIALLDSEDVEILRKDQYADREVNAISVFEEFVNGGLSEISMWLASRAPDDYMTEIIDRVNSRIEKEVAIVGEEISFY